VGGNSWIKKWQQNGFAHGWRIDLQNLSAVKQRTASTEIGRTDHTSFLLWGDGEEMGSFNPTIHAIVKVVGKDILWELPKTEEAETPKPAVVN
jgi:hypothetical protein